MPAEVHAEVKSVVIPVRAVIPAPLPVSRHSFTVSLNSLTVFAMASDVPVDTSAVNLEPAMAVFSPVPISKCRFPDWQREREC